MTESKIKLIYIAGEIRSGTTVLDLLISDSRDVISVGELLNLEDFIDKKDIGKSCNWICSCGKQVENCTFWSNIIDRHIAIRNNRITTKARKIYSDEQNMQIAENCWNIAKKIAENEKKKIILDSSKTDLQLKFLEKTKNGNKLIVIYLIRDSRAVSYSKSNWDIKFNRRKKPAFTRHMIRWLITNISIIKLLSKKNKTESIVLSYEIFAKHPSRTLKMIFEKFNINSADKDLNIISLAGKHTIAGTPNKSRLKNKPITLDTRWKKIINSKNKPMIFIFGGLCNLLIDLYVGINKLNYLHSVR